MRDYMRLIGWLALAVLTIAILWIFIIPLAVGTRYAGREFQKFDAETSAQVYDNSRQYQQGTNRDVARYCRQWHEADEGGKKAVADLIRTTTDTYQGPLTPANQDCLKEIN